MGGAGGEQRTRDPAGEREKKRERGRERERERDSETDRQADGDRDRDRDRDRETERAAERRRERAPRLGGLEGWVAWKAGWQRVATNRTALARGGGVVTGVGQVLELFEEARAGFVRDGVAAYRVGDPGDGGALRARVRGPPPPTHTHKIALIPKPPTRAHTRARASGVCVWAGACARAAGRACAAAGAPRAHRRADLQSASRRIRVRLGRSPRPTRQTPPRV